MRRIVTGYDDEGKATITAVNQLAAAAPKGKESELLYFWRTFGGHTVPVPAGDPTEGMTDFFPPADGTTCIVGLIPPEDRSPST